MKRLIAAAVAGAGLALLVDICGAQTATDMAADIRTGLEGCGEFHGHPFTFSEFAGDHGRRRDSWRYSDFRVENNVMHWKKYLVTRTEGANSVSGQGNVYYYTVRLTDLARDTMPVEEVRNNNQNEGIFFVDLQCQGGSSCIAQNGHPLTPPSQTRDGISQPVEGWIEGPNTPRMQRDARLHICPGTQGGSKNMADALRFEMKAMLNQVRSGAMVNLGGSAAPQFVPGAPQPYVPPFSAPPQPYIPPPGAAPQPYASPPGTGQPYYGPPPGAASPYPTPPTTGASPFPAAPSSRGPMF